MSCLELPMFRRIVLSAVTAVLAVLHSTSWSEGMQGRTSAIEYPPARTEKVMDGRLGVSFPDPYRWLEGDTQEVRDWQRAQARLADDYVSDWPHFPRLLERTELYLSAADRSVDVPRAYANGKWYVLKSATRIVETGSLEANASDTGRVIVDVKQLSLGDNAIISWLSPSPDAAVVAFGVVTDGSESNTMYLVDTASGKLIPNAPAQQLVDIGAGAAHWLPDSSGFFFQGLTSTLHDFQLKTFLHKLRPAVSTELQAIPMADAFTAVSVSGDGRWAVATSRALNRIPCAIKDLSRPDAPWQPFLESTIEGTVAGFVLDGRYVAVTDVGAPRGRIVAIALDSKTANDPSTWKELVPQSDRIVRGLQPIQNRLYVFEYLNTYSRVRIFDRDGSLQGEMPLPGNGVVSDPRPLGNTHYRGHPDELIYSFSSLTQSPALYRYKLGQAASEQLIEPAVSLKDTVVKDMWAVSPDGTKIPYHIVHRSTLDVSKPQPTLIHGYGGFNFALAPQFPGSMATFIDAGGIFVHAHLRGGSELGKQWWEGGRLKNKQNTFQDLYAIATSLIASGATSRDKLAVTGMSNGGLLAGVAVTQRPDLWRVAVPRVPILDLIGGLRDPYGYMGIEADYADPDDAAELKRLASFSPYHLVRKGTNYPAVYLVGGETDYHTPPWHARKFVARLQAATSGRSPILLRIWENAGHGAATASGIRLKQEACWMGFVMKELGMQPELKQ